MFEFRLALKMEKNAQIYNLGAKRKHANKEVQEMLMDNI